jgi:sulfatase maturation enzyme AslB (radical SAM superfamily)
VRDLRGKNPEFFAKCRRCTIIDLCLWCPAHAALETGALDGWVEHFCEMAHARAAALQDKLRTDGEDRVGMGLPE